MNGLLIRVPAASTDTTSLPKLYPHPMMSIGSLVLFDMTVGGTPANLNNNTPIKNVAVDTAAAILGSGNDSTLSIAIVRGTGYTGSVGLAEVTPKLGLHTIISQVNHTTNTGAPSGQHFLLTIPQPIINYLLANQAHNYYFSVWRKDTRAAVSGVDFAKAVLLFTNTVNYLSYEQPSFTRLSPIGNTGRGPNTIDLNNYIKNTLIQGPTGTTSASTYAGSSIIAQGGGLPAFSSGTILNKLPSYITYYVYLEDLTVSGRTYAAVDALDKSLFDEAFAVGGKFYGDTYTSPSTLP